MSKKLGARVVKGLVESSMRLVSAQKLAIGSWWQRWKKITLLTRLTITLMMSHSFVACMY